jgi:hypothetical protein
MREAEYLARFDGVDLLSLRQRMEPQVFIAFVRHLGVIEGREGTDADDLVRDGQD